MWRHTRRGDRYVTVVIDLTPVRDRSGPAQLLDVVPGRSKKAIQDLALPARPGLAWAGRGGSHGAASPGPESAADQELPQARAVMDPYARRVPDQWQARPVPPMHPTRSVFNGLCKPLRWKD